MNEKEKMERLNKKIYMVLFLQQRTIENFYSLEPSLILLFLPLNS